LQSWTGGALPGVDLILYGALLILCVAFAPKGIMGLARARP
jgi:ABC-type branched-subunit amino acid transport system permease subunit